MASFFGINTWFYKNVTELSGGQKQILNLASIMVMQPSVLILDEPTSQLDPIAAREFLQTLKKINSELATTIVLTEHRLEDAFSIVDRVIVMEEGKIIANDVPDKIGKILRNHNMYRALPTPIRVYNSVENSISCPITVKDGREWLEKYSKEHLINSDVIPKDIIKDNNNAVIEIKNAYFRYKKDLPDVIKGMSLSVNKGELYCLLGGNGAGKTTALSIISGLNRPYRGDILINGEDISKIKNLYSIISSLPQNPESIFVKNSVYLDLMEFLSDKNLSKDEKEEKIKYISKLCKIENLLNFHPYDLSGGEKQRAALAKVLLSQPEILLLDEPTKGMDAHFKEEFADILSDLKSNGVTIVMVSHDIEFCAKYADRCALMFDGGIASVDAPRKFFKGKRFYTTSANRMARTCLSDAILAEDIILACGGMLEKKPQNKKGIDIRKDIKNTKTDTIKIETEKNRKKLQKKSLWVTTLMLLVISLTICVGVLFFDSRKYYFISILIICETVMMFSMRYESKKPKARDVVLVSVLCSIAISGRMAFFAIPEFKPTTALIIISAVCFGKETGFLVGAITGFISNFFFGQGPWTPWQMFAFGIVGFISGIVFKKEFIKKSKLLLCIFGFLASFVIYGGIMNSASVIMVQNKITWQMILTALVAGMPFDLIHAFSTAFFLWFLSGAMIEKFERIKVKYGIMTT